ncbi:hypothetical protein [Amaricoccus sp.]|uniref:hypothetical protein n=1 Tax=Amaricoccus sp. TaxID=1872485 RepID=UPI001B7995D7|nr:hypothetical protein [Amaricoccus sp.]MBP7002283.1 hypothetical protein [Amaricoccus sp.]
MTAHAPFRLAEGVRLDADTAHRFANRDIGAMTARFARLASRPASSRRGLPGKPGVGAQRLARQLVAGMREVVLAHLYEPRAGVLCTVTVIATGQARTRSTSP